MDLSNFKIFPGVVIDIDDPKKIGRVKASAPGLFNPDVMSKEALPWIYPSNMTGYQSFSALRNGRKIWIITDKEYHEFWYWPMFEINSDTKDILSDDEDYKDGEVLLARNNGDMGVYIYYSPSKGIIIQNTDNTFINVTNENKIIIKSGNNGIEIKDDKVSIGNLDDKMSKVVKGEELKLILNNLKMAFLALKTVVDPRVALLMPGFNAAYESLNNIDNILAKNTEAN